jgi:GntR family transcriptional regulator
MAAEPIHAHVRHEFLRRINEGRWQPGSCIPGEVDLAAELQVSVGTVRRALDDLVGARLLERRRRRGTMVTAHTQAGMRDHFFSLVRRSDHDKDFPRHAVRHFATREPDRLTAGVLGPGTVHEIETVGSLHGEVVLYDRIAIPEALAPGLSRAVYEAKPSSAFALYQQLYGVTVSRAIETVEAVAAPVRIAKALGVEAGSPLLEIRRSAVALDGTFVEFRRRWARTGTHVYLNRMGADPEG